MSQPDNINWKERYSQLLEEVEQEQQLQQQQLQLLQRALGRSLLAAEGNDPKLDKILSGARKQLHQLIEPAKISQLVQDLEATLLETEQMQQQRLDSLHQSLDAMSGQLLELKPQTQLRKSIQTYRTALNKTLTANHLLAKQLDNYCNLQQQVVEQLSGDQPEPASSSFFSFLRPRKKAGQPETEQAREASTDEAVSDEEVFSQASRQIQNTLLRLLDSFPGKSEQQTKLEQLRNRIQEQYNYFELAVILDDLAQLMDKAYNNSQADIKQYLGQLYQRLNQVGQNLQLTQDQYQQGIGLGASFDRQMQNQMQEIGDDLRSHDDLELLKHTIDQRMSTFSQTLLDYKQQRNEHELELQQKFDALQKRVHKMETQAQQVNQRLTEQLKRSLLDPLTGIANRAAWDERFALEHARLKRSDEPLCMAVIDIDFFKQVNDTYGHAAGDKVLKIFAGRIKQNIRQTDFLARYGGEEFVLLLQNTSLDNAQRLVDSIRQKIADTAFHFNGEPVQITFSAGVGQLQSDEPASEAFIRIDQALYKAKHQGRNQVVSAGNAA